MPDAPGLGIEIDNGRVEEAHALYRLSGTLRRDDSIAMQFLIPKWTFDAKQPCLVRNDANLMG